MRRFVAVAQFPLVAIFCVAFTGSAAAATPPTPTVSGGFPPLINTQVTAAPDTADPGDLVVWATCGTYQVGVSVATGTPTATYTLLPSDAGNTVCAYELAPVPTTQTGPVDGVSAPVGPVGSGPTLNAAGASVTEGQTVSVTPGAWGGSVPTDAWVDCDPTGVTCPPGGNGATGTSYTTTRSDVGSTLEVYETATAPDGTTATETTAPSGVVVATPPVITSSPTVSGTAQVGDTLTVTPGSWSNDPTAYTYQWDRCAAGTCTPIIGATASTYVPVAADVGDVLLAYVTAAIDPGTQYGAVGSPYPSYPTGPVLGIATSPPPPSVPPPGPVVPVPNPHTSKAVGRLTATMQWTFRYAPTYTQILALAVEGPALGSTIETRCNGRGCPLRVHRITVRELRRCAHTGRRCRAPRTLSLEWEFHRHRLGIGTRVTIMISRSRDIGKYYRFVVRARRPPSVRISCLAPGSVRPGKGCSLP